MKKQIILSFLVAVLFAGVQTVQAQGGIVPSFSNQTHGTAQTAAMKWVETAQDLGEISQNKPVKIVFEFKNEGLVPVIISNVKASCGCTATDYPKQPLAPGQTGKITATYDAKSLGSFYKTIKVWANTGEGPTELKISGTVVK